MYHHPKYLSVFHSFLTGTSELIIHALSTTLFQANNIKLSACLISHWKIDTKSRIDFGYIFTCLVSRWRRIHK